MLRKATVPIVMLMFLVVVLPFFYLFSFSLSLEKEVNQPVAYELPYPGIMNDNPLYVFKKIRDQVLEFSTRDQIKKAQLQLLFADKNVRAAELLQKNGHEDRVVPELEESQENFRKALESVTESKQQGVSASAQLLNTLALSNLKHREVIIQLHRAAASAQQDGLEAVLEENGHLKEQLKKL